MLAVTFVVLARDQQVLTLEQSASVTLLSDSWGPIDHRIKQSRVFAGVLSPDPDAGLEFTSFYVVGFKTSADAIWR